MTYHPIKIEKKLHSNLIVEHIDRLPEIKEEHNIEIGVISTPVSKVQEVANRLVDADIKAVLNFAPAHIQAPKGFCVESVDFTVKLTI